MSPTITATTSKGRALHVANGSTGLTYCGREVAELRRPSGELFTITDKHGENPLVIRAAANCRTCQRHERF